VPEPLAEPVGGTHGVVDRVELDGRVFVREPVDVLA
jgi:hypothetical protein